MTEFWTLEKIIRSIISRPQGDIALEKFVEYETGLKVRVRYNQEGDEYYFVEQPTAPQVDAHHVAAPHAPIVPPIEERNRSGHEPVSG